MGALVESVAHRPAWESEMTFLVQWKLEHSTKMEVIKRFGQLNLEDDAASMHAAGVHQVGRWHNMAEGTGAGVFEAATMDGLHSYLYDWLPFATFTVSPVLDDAATQEVILSKLG